MSYRHPTIDEITEAELLDILKNAPHAYLSNWEEDFCASIQGWLLLGKTLTSGQTEVFRKGLLYRLQDNDPALWRPYPLGMLQINVDENGVAIEDVEVRRPATIDAKLWIDFWEAISSLEYLRSQDLEDRIKVLEAQLKELKDKKTKKVVK